MDILTKQCPTVQRLNYRRNILSETTTRMKKSPPSSQPAAWERRRLLDTCDRRQQQQQQQQLVVIVVLPPSRAPSEAWGRLRNMHTNDNDSSTLVASPVTAGPLGRGEVKARFPSSEPQPRRGKGKGTNAKRWPSRMRATLRKLYYRRRCIKIHRKRDCPRLVV